MAVCVAASIPAAWGWGSAQRHLLLPGVGDPHQAVCGYHAATSPPEVEPTARTDLLPVQGPFQKPYLVWVLEPEPSHGD